MLVAHLLSCCRFTKLRSMLQGLSRSPSNLPLPPGKIWPTPATPSATPLHPPGLHWTPPPLLQCQQSLQCHSQSSNSLNPALTSGTASASRRCPSLHPIQQLLQQLQVIRAPGHLSSSQGLFQQGRARLTRAGSPSPAPLKAQHSRHLHSIRPQHRVTPGEALTRPSSRMLWPLAWLWLTPGLHSTHPPSLKPKTLGWHTPACIPKTLGAPLTIWLPFVPLGLQLELDLKLQACHSRRSMHSRLSRHSMR